MKIYLRSLDHEKAQATFSLSARASWWVIENEPPRLVRAAGISTPLEPYAGTVATRRGGLRLMNLDDNREFACKFAYATRVIVTVAQRMIKSDIQNEVNLVCEWEPGYYTAALAGLKPRGRAFDGGAKYVDYLKGKEGGSGTNVGVPGVPPPTPPTPPPASFQPPTDV